MPKEKKPEGCPFWLLTFGDIMSLLLTFFVLLMTFSSLNVSKLLDIVGGIQGALGARNPIIKQYKDIKMLPETKDPTETGKMLASKAEMTRVAKEAVTPVNLRSELVHNKFNEYKQQIAKLGFQNFVTAEKLDEGIAVTVSADKLFQPDGASLTAEAPYLLQGFANIAKSIGNELRVTYCYHADQTSGGEVFRSPLALLARKRDKAVGDFLMGKYKVSPTRLGYSIDAIAGDLPDYLRMVLVERLGVSEVDLNEVIKDD